MREGWYKQAIEDIRSTGDPSITSTCDAKRPHIAVISATLMVSFVRITTMVNSPVFSHT